MKFKLNMNLGIVPNLNSQILLKNKLITASNQYQVISGCFLFVFASMLESILSVNEATIKLWTNMYDGTYPFSANGKD